MRESVIVLRLKTGEDVIGIIVGEKNNVIRMEHPYFAKYSINTGNVSMMPYCPLTDETYFEFNKDNIEFVVTAANTIATKFINLINDVQMMQARDVLDALEEILEEENNSSVQMMEGNSTKH